MQKIRNVLFTWHDIQDIHYYLCTHTCIIPNSMLVISTLHMWGFNMHLLASSSHFCIRVQLIVNVCFVCLLRSSGEKCNIHVHVWLWKHNRSRAQTDSMRNGICNTSLLIKTFCNIITKHCLAFLIICAFHILLKTFACTMWNRLGTRLVYTCMYISLKNLNDLHWMQN